LEILGKKKIQGPKTKRNKNHLNETKIIQGNRKKREHLGGSRRDRKKGFKRLKSRWVKSAEGVGGAGNEK